MVLKVKWIYLFIEKSILVFYFLFLDIVLCMNKLMCVYASTCVFEFTCVCAYLCMWIWCSDVADQKFKLSDTWFLFMTYPTQMCP